MYQLTQSPQWIITASGDAVNLAFTKRLFIWVDGFGVKRTYYVKAVVDGGSAQDSWIILKVFETLDDAKDYVLKITGVD